MRGASVLAQETTALVMKWEQAAVTLDRFGATQAADTLREVAAEVAELRRRIEERESRLSVAEFALARGVEPATVRRWIRNGELPATLSQDGTYTVALTARRQRAPRQQGVAA